MDSRDDAVVRVHQEWDGWRSAEVRSSDLRDVHWFQPRRAPQRLVHGYVSCAKVAHDLQHDCEGTPAHRLRVCILKRHTVPTTYAELARRADARRR
jgi:hypothetical protein